MGGADARAGRGLRLFAQTGVDAVDRDRRARSSEGLRPHHRAYPGGGPACDRRGQGRGADPWLHLLLRDERDRPEGTGRAGDRRSEERRGGKEGVSTWKARGSAEQEKKNKKNK